MKHFAVFATLILAISALDQEFIAQMKAKMKEQVESCAKEVSASPNDVADIFAHKMPSSHEGKCIFFCLHKRFNAQNEDGSLNMAGALENLELIKDLDADLFAKVTTTFKNCEGTPTDSDPCVYAANIVECLVREKTAVGLDDMVIE